jgi:hypothetical protein
MTSRRWSACGWALYLAFACVASLAIATAHAQVTGGAATTEARGLAYGIIPDDGIDDGAAFNRAATAGVKVLRLEPGRYNLDPSIAFALTAGMTIDGAGKEATIIDLTDGKTGSAFRMATGSVLSDLTILGDGASSANGVICVSGGSTNNYRVERVRFEGLSVGASDNGVSRNATYYECDFVNCINVGYQDGSASLNPCFLFCRFEGCPTGIIRGASSRGGLIYGCDFQGATTGVSLSTTGGVSVEACDFNATTSIVIGASVVRCAIGENHYQQDEILPSDVANKQCRLLGRYLGTASPSSGTWQVGDRVSNSTPGTSAGTAVEWACSTAGTSGTWQPLYRGTSVSYATTLDPPEIDQGESWEVIDSGATGFAVGDGAAWYWATTVPDGVVLQVQITAANTIKVQIVNIAGGDNLDIGSGSFTVRAVR